MDIVTGVGVLDKAMTIVRAVADRPQSLPGLQEATGFPRATVHRLAAALEQQGMLRRGVDGRYELGHGLVALARSAREGFPLAERARPILSTLRDDTGESVQLYVREGAQRRCVLSLETPHGLRWIVPEGSVFPLDAGSAGRVLSAGTSVGGWVESVGEREPGVASVSAAVADGRDDVVAAVSVSGPIERLSREPGQRFGDAVIAAADALSVALAD
ncbi:IclR family transcriptional regulator [Ilumatobacter nonamiensis]|uniref:IclR family transcriptional regulator n=1 Tax=Ilumatobacter nonamiensis TaxID=467093 RepID=UPI00058E8FBD|nr:IclR family transcriptional regulator [Ilumatobacter nonamiensis]